MFVIQPLNATKEMLLARNTEERYFAHYLGINPTKGLFKSPIRQDKNPTCSFYRNKKNELIFKDFGNGFHGNFISVVMEIFKVPYYKALSIIANDFGIIEKPHYEKNEAKIDYDGTVIDEKKETIIQVEVKDYTAKELEWWDKQGISAATLKKFKVFSIKNVFINGQYFCTSSNINPIYGYYFGIKEGRELWKIYFPLKTSYRFLLNTDVLQGLKQIPKAKDKKQEYVVVTKSYKDVMALYELGIPAVAPQAESVILNSRQFDYLNDRFNTVIFNGDWDRAGQRFMIESRKKYPSICLSFKDKTVYGKDMSDFISLHGREKAATLIDRVGKLIRSGRLDYQRTRCRE